MRKKTDHINTRFIYDKYVLEGGKISYEAFKELIFAYNKAMIQECIDTGNEWYLHGQLGLIKISKIRRKSSVTEDGQIKSRVNMPASLKFREELKARGELPLENYKDEEGKIIGNNGGVPWYVYYTDDTFYRWSYLPYLYLVNGNKYKFTPSWTNKRLLSNSINDNSELLYSESIRKEK